MLSDCDLVKSCVISGPMDLCKQVMFEMAINYAADGKHVNYITSKPLSSAVLQYHDRKELPVEALKKIHFRYFQTYEELSQGITNLWIDDAVSTVLLIDELDSYISSAAVDDSKTEYFKAKLFSQILDSMRLCANILQHQTIVCLWTSTNCSQKSLQRYFKNFWAIEQNDTSPNIINFTSKISNKTFKQVMLQGSFLSLGNVNHIIYEE